MLTRTHLFQGGAALEWGDQGGAKDAKEAGGEDDSGELDPDLGFYEEPVKGIVDTGGDGEEGSAGGEAGKEAGGSAWWGWNRRGEVRGERLVAVQGSRERWIMGCGMSLMSTGVPHLSENAPL